MRTAGDGLDDDQIAGRHNGNHRFVEDADKAVGKTVLCLIGRCIFIASFFGKHLEQTEFLNVAGNGRLRHVNISGAQRSGKLLLRFNVL